MDVIAHAEKLPMSADDNQQASAVGADGVNSTVEKNIEKEMLTDDSHLSGSPKSNEQSKLTEASAASNDKASTIGSDKEPSASTSTVVRSAEWRRVPGSGQPNPALDEELESHMK